MAYTLSTNEEAGKALIKALEGVGDAAKSFESVSSGIRNTQDTFYTKPEPKSYGDMAEIAIAAAKEEQEICAVTRIFNYRPWDGAHATAKTLYETFGYAGFGKTIPATMFSPEQPPERRTIEVGPGQTIEVPWGQLFIPDLKCTLLLQSTTDFEKGALFVLTGKCPKLMEKAVTGLFNMIELCLKEHSIYKGKAIAGADYPEFIDLSKVDERNVIYRQTVQENLEHEVWFPIAHHDLIKMDNQPTRWVTLLDGQYGTGKTLAIQLTAKKCEENGITFLQVRPGQDELKYAMQTAALYSPCVVAFEDVDTIADPTKTGGQEISHLLEAFDGMRSKGADIQVILTTNHSDRIHAGLLRAGRLHTYIVFSDLDSDALYKLLTVKVGVDRLAEIDQEAVFTACEGYTPAFMDLVIQVARRYALSRNYKRLNDEFFDIPDEEYLNYQISTEDLVDAANRLRAQKNKMDEATKKEPIDTFSKVFDRSVREAVSGMQMYDQDGDPCGTVEDRTLAATK